jgi:hypothetical protein
MKYTREQMETRITNYLMKTSKHLFVDGNNKFYKVMLTKDSNDQWVYITVRFNEDSCDVRVKPIVVSNSPYHTTDLEYLQNNLFPKWEKRQSIPFFKEARLKMYEVLKSVRTHYDGSKESLTKINEDTSEILKGMQFNKAA